MFPAEPLNTCTSCDVRHYDNCPTCYGFGLRESGLAVSANAAMRKLKGPANSKACPTCHSTFAGTPDALREAGQ